MKTIYKLFLTFAVFSVSIAHAEIITQVQNTTPSSLPKNAVRVKFMDVTLTNTSQTPESIRSLTLKRAGLSSSEDLGRIWLETSDFRRSFARQLNNDDQVELKFRNPIVLAPDTSAIVSVFANIESESGNKTIRLDLMGVNDQVSVSETEINNIETEPDTTNPSNTNATPQLNYQEPAKVEVKPSYTSQPSRFTPEYQTDKRKTYDRSRYRISCKNSKCMLIER